MRKNRESARKVLRAKASEFERLERRALLSDGPFPPLESLEDPENAVIRVHTAFGDIDIEMFHHQVPTLVASILENLDSHRQSLPSDRTFFHRLTPGISLQGGQFAYFVDGPAAGLASPSWAYSDERSGIGRANTQRTVAIGRLLDAQPLVVSNLIINLADNSARHDPETIIVYGRVLGDESWSVVQAIASLPTADLSSATIDNFFPGSFGSTPITGTFTPAGPDDPEPVIDADLLVETYDVTIIKAPEARDFYRYAIYSPEGFTGATISEFLPVANPNDEPVYYEITAHYEAAPDNTRARDRRIATGVIAPNARAGVTISTPQNWSDAVVLHGRPYAIEIRTTLPVAANLSHYDFGVATGEALLSQTAATWVFPHIERTLLGRDFLVWYNPGDEPAVITITFLVGEGAAPPSLQVTTDRFRRGGISVRDWDLLPFSFGAGVQIDSSVPIVASLTRYFTQFGTGSPAGYATPGAHTPTTVGVIPIASDPDSPDVRDPFLLYCSNPGTEEAVIDVEFFAPGEMTPSWTVAPALRLGAGMHGTVSLPNVGSPLDGPRTLVFRSTRPVYALFDTRRLEDAYGLAVAIAAARTVHFADGFMDPERTAPNVLEEDLVIFNPATLTAELPDQDATVSIIFRYVDGHVLTLQRTVFAGAALWLSIAELPEVIAEARDNGRYFYSIEVSSDVPIVAQMFHTDVELGMNAGSGGFSTLGMQLGPLTFLGMGG